MDTKYLHTIQGIAKGVCSVEQMIAYNFMHRDYKLNCTATKIALMAWDEMHRNLDKYGKYDIKAICWLISMRGEAYRGLKYHILTSYQSVGEIFHLNN